jgi:hypothetical protein
MGPRFNRRKRESQRNIRGAASIDLVAAYLNPEEDTLHESEVEFHKELESFMIECVPLYYSVLEYIKHEIEPYL